MAASPVPSPETALDEYVTYLKTQTDKAVKTAAELPQDIPFHRTLDRNFRTELDATSARLLRLTNRLLKLAETLDVKSRPISGKPSHRDGDKVALADEEDVVDKFHSVVVDVFDPLLEHVDHCLDIHAGRVKPVQEYRNPVKEKETGGELQKAARLPQHILHAANLPKPQLRFIDKVDNANGNKWQHHPSKKWHLKERPDQMELTSEDGTPLQTHPYRYEIATLEYPDSVSTSRVPIPPKSFEDTPFTYIDTKEGLFSLLDKLRQSEEIAIDLEHHSYRSYYGFVCLMQISTRHEDFVVDCLVPEIRENLEGLNEVFTDPTKIKVLHGAESDIVWLQENFNLYIVNMFDTFHASRALDLPRHSLAFLLSVYCDFTADKRYQLADWRIRPLPSEMLHYARSDTHFLLFVYDQLREALIERSKIPDPSTSGLVDGPQLIPSFIQTVLKYSAETSLREFVREQYDEEKGEGMRGWAGLARKWNKRSLLVDGPQRRVFLAVHKWRDQVARDEDESPVFVISNQALLMLIEKPVPTNLIGLYSSFPGAVPPLIRKRGTELLLVMQDAASKAPVAETAIMEVEDKQMSVVVDAPRHTVFPSQATPVPDLWNMVSLPSQVASTKVVASRSSLFGNLVAVARSIGSQKEGTGAPTAAKLSTRHSSFFGPSSLSTSTSIALKPTPTTTPAGDNAQHKIAKIHEGILNGNKKVIRRDNFLNVLQPVVNIQIQTTEVANTGSGASVSLETGEPATETLPAPAPLPEMAFIPRSQRLTTKTEEDEIVQVGQRKKKRKRGDDVELDTARRRKKTIESSDLSTGNDREEKEMTPELQVFDYSAGPNILDEGMKDVDDSKSGRKGRHGRKDASKEKGTRLDFKALGFGPTPKQTNEPKSGNKSMTFR